jgi:hypothetical protein
VTDILHVLNGAAVTVFAQDSHLKYRWMINRPAGWGASEPAGQDDAALLPPTAAAIAAALKRDVMASGEPRISVTGAGSGDSFSIVSASPAARLEQCREELATDKPAFRPTSRRTTEHRA